MWFSLINVHRTTNIPNAIFSVITHRRQPYLRVSPHHEISEPPRPSMSVNAQFASSGYRPASFPLEPSLVLPTELYETLNYVYFLHSLAVTPDSVLPPGKSLLSVLSRPYTHDHASKNSDLHKRVETIVHKAFWDEVRPCYYSHCVN